MKSTSFKYVFSLSLLLVLFGCGKKTTTEYLQEGTQAASSGNIEQAIIHFKNAIRNEPENIVARESLAQIYFDRGRYINAEKEFGKAIELGAQNWSTVLGLAYSQAQIGDLAGVESILEQAGGYPTEQYGQLLYLAGVTSAMDRRKDNAQDYLNQVAAMDVVGISSLAQAYLSYMAEDYLQGAKLLDGLQIANVFSRDLVLLRGHLQFGLQDFAKAVEHYNVYLTQVPKDYRVLFYLANGQLHNEQYDDAEKTVDDLLKIDAKSGLANQYKAQILYQKNDYREAINYADRAILANSELYIPQMIGALSAYRLNQFEQSYDYLKPLVRFLDSSHPLKKLLSIVQLKLGYHDRAANNLKLLEGLNEEDIELLRVASIELFKAKDFETAEQLIKKARTLSPSNALVDAQANLIKLAKDSFSGVETLERTLALSNQLPQSELALALNYIRLEDYERAHKLADNWAGNENTAIAGNLLKGLLFTHQENDQSAIKAFELVLKKDLKNTVALYNLAIVKERNGNIAQARQHYRTMVELEPYHKGALEHLSRLAYLNKELDENIDFLSRLSVSQSDNTDLSIALAQNYRLNKQLDNSVKLLKSLSNKKSLPSTYWLILGDIFIQQKNYQQAELTFSQGLAKHNNDYTLMLRLIGVSELLGKFEQALQLTEEAYFSYPNNGRLELLLAYYQQRNGNTASAKEMLAKVESKRLQHYLVEQLRGDFYLRDKKYQQAIDAYNNSFAAKPSDTSAINLARALKFSGQQAAAESLLEDYVKGKRALRVRLLLTELYAPEARDKKIAQLKVINEFDKNNTLVLNNLAWNSYKIGSHEVALEYIERAIDLSPEHLPLLETYGVILAANKLDDKARAILTKAVELGSKDKEVLLLYGSI